ncbi:MULTISPECIES: hypothetical protein [unclassified Oleiphilus]|nr:MULTISPECIES: hypothetical protein [unclassified Oleiphilus]KZY44403.1 hypothetical protein A3732_12445 [Oleiphilus sp. HI0050]KZY74992.1 hypothetical protein A3740_16360 [Oleiphilus sp. HI0068]KZY81126.1 hypothetical protein A3741_17785 [Oleiphilus sp. HI0069]KZY86780.1 hypothetical protein A3743_02255 [Oleiphilus sp. HI0072]KZY33540.1 hypothetical protein A3729_06325 [Oleiphilus sp. HI0043]
MKKYKKTYWGAIPKEFKAHDNVIFKRFGRRSNWSSATSILGLKGGACAKTMFFSMLARTVHSNPDLFESIPPVSINWSERFVDDGDKTLVVEHGWLPRSSYQISPHGANARSHTQFDSGVDYVERIGRRDLEHCKARAQHFLRPKKVDIAGLTQKPFCLLPLQGGEDYNLKFSDSGFESLYGQKGANDLLAQALIDRSYAEAQGVNIIVTEHPAKKCRLSNAPTLPKGVTFIEAKKGIRSIDLAAHKNCVGVVSVNSNLVHEAMVLGKPVCSYGRLMYKSDDKPMFSSIADMLTCGEQDLSLADQYLALLFLSQWELTDLMDPIIVQTLLNSMGKVFPWELRRGI